MTNLTQQGGALGGQRGLSPFGSFLPKALGTEGQSQIMGVMILSMAMLTAGLFTMDRAQKAQEITIKASRVTEMRSALEAAILRAANLYRTEANCDPAILQRKLSYLQPDGTLDEPLSVSSPVATDHSSRILNVTVNGRTYEVSFGAVTPLEWTGGTDPSLDTAAATASPDNRFPASAGTSQDTEIEVWTTVPNQAAGPAGGTRTSMVGVLINSCQILCERKLPADGHSAAGEVCLQGSNISIANNPGTDLPLNATVSSTVSAMTSSVAISRTSVPCANSGATPLTIGNLPVKSDVDDDNDSAPTIVNALDLSVLNQYLQQRDTNWIKDGESIAAVSNLAAGPPSCADVNLDGEVTDMDRTLLQKWLRGYLFRIPVNPDGRQ